MKQSPAGLRRGYLLLHDNQAITNVLIINTKSLTIIWKVG
jgi:hypothetical protein